MSTNQAANKTGTAPSLVGKSVVIVEDEGVILLAIRKALSHAGLRVVAAAGNGIDGLAAILREKPDLVLMDIQMPGLLGTQVAARALDSVSTCIVFMSAYDMDTYREELESLDYAGYLNKPVNPSALASALERAFALYLERPGPRGRSDSH